MAIPVGKVRTASMVNRHEKLAGWHPDNSCELCRKPIKPDHGHYVAIDHERYEFVTMAEANVRGDAVSLFIVGADCQRRIRIALDTAGKLP